MGFPSSEIEVYLKTFPSSSNVVFILHKPKGKIYHIWNKCNRNIYISHIKYIGTFGTSCSDYSG
jgi:hypothetical protein